MIKILVKHTYCYLPNIVINTEKSISEINKIIYLIQYIESDLPSVSSEGDGIYQDDLKTLLTKHYGMSVEDYKDHNVDYEIDIYYNWEWSGSINFEEHKKDWQKWHTLNEEKKDYQSTFKKELYEKAYIDNLELFLIDHRLKQCKTVSDKKLFSEIKNAVQNKDESFYWNSWCGRDTQNKINCNDFLSK